MARWDNWNPPTLENPVAQFEWTAPYAALVHEGAEGSGIIYPPRPWTDHAVSETNFEQVFADGFQKDFSLATAFQAVVDAFEDACKVAMSSPIGYWPVATRRYNGQIVPPGPRDARDLDVLYESLVITRQEGFSYA